MSKPALITLTPQERRTANAFHNDPGAWRMQEGLANRQVRDDIRRLARAIEIAEQHPDDEDCARLLAAVRRSNRDSR